MRCNRKDEDVPIYDISMPVYYGMPVYKNRAEKQPQVEVTRNYEEGVRETRWLLDSHTGTHIDAPAHVFAGGMTIDGLDLSLLIGSCRVLDLTAAKERISAAALEGQDIRPGDFILFKTKNSWETGNESSFVYLDAGAAVYLVKKGVRGVGLDALGIERDQPGHPAHRILLENGVIIIEGLRLKDIPAGVYQMVALPLLLKGAEAAPARVVLCAWTI
ncbi:Kynurenine formamidase [Moorella humiferrea]|uniref:Kynurenine formamidase n=1 Tax=Neomoorella humiferrea TaxID=676965 RepID=A0A2T0ARJ4_9FIRM|nr:cyclase family protein [Moorella humiferrea]PRR72460.1 Kynurenine formamidase [Moorella humiferrea]